MKRVLTLALAAILLVSSLFAFASCNGNGGPGTGTTPPTESGYDYGKEVLALTSQLDALNGLKKGDADLAVIDSVMAGYYMNDTDAFKDYQVLPNVVLAEEEYGIAAKKGNEALMSKINEALIALVDTDYKTVAETYGLSTELLVTAETADPYANATDASWTELVASGKLVIGYTVFAPIAYTESDDADAELIGFDIDLAKAVVAYLNATYSTAIEIEFVKIEWNSKETLLENGSIDLVWNGMTIDSDRLAAMTISVPYLANKQVAVVAKTDADKFASANLTEFADKVKDAIITVEKGSAGEALVVGSDEE